MVGILRSTGCRTCITRHVKCDERRPTCARCEKAGVKCHGYRSGLQFVDESRRLQRHGMKPVTAPAPAPAPAAPETSLILASDKNNGTNIEEIPRTLDLRPFEDHIYSSFLLANLLAGADYLRPWIQISMQDTQSTTQKSMSALGAVYFGQMRHNSRAMVKGLTSYGDAMKSLNQDLQVDSTAMSVSVLKSAIALQTVELFAFSSRGGWLQHAGGIGKIIQLRGPSGFRAPEPRYYLEMSRVLVTLGHFVRRKRCFLEEEAWQTIPWLDDPENDARNLTLRMHDIFAFIPGLMEDADRLQQYRFADNNTGYFDLRNDLSWRIVERITELLKWRAAWEKRNPECCYTLPPMQDIDPIAASPPNGITNNNVPCPFTSMIHFHNLEVSNLLIMADCTMGTLYTLGTLVMGDSFDFASLARNHTYPITNPALLVPSDIRNVAQIATEVARCVEYHVLDHHKSAGAYLVMFPMRWAFGCFDPESPEAKWLRGKMKTIADATGFEIVRKLDEARDLRHGLSKPV